MNPGKMVSSINLFKCFQVNKERMTVYRSLRKEGVLRFVKKDVKKASQDS